MADEFCPTFIHQWVADFEQACRSACAANDTGLFVELARLLRAAVADPQPDPAAG